MIYKVNFYESYHRTPLLKKARSLRQPELKQVPFIAPLFEIRLKIGKLTKEETFDEKRERRENLQKKADNKKCSRFLISFFRQPWKRQDFLIILRRRRFPTSLSWSLLTTQGPRLRIFRSFVVKKLLSPHWSRLSGKLTWRKVPVRMRTSGCVEAIASILRGTAGSPGSQFHCAPKVIHSLISGSSKTSSPMTTRLETTGSPRTRR